MRIAVDAMGGDFAPYEIVWGAAEAAHKLKEIDQILLVGQKDAIFDAWKTPHPHVKKIDPHALIAAGRLHVIHAEETIGMHEAPAVAVRKKKKCSINICFDLLKQGQADAALSAGNSGAMAAAAVFSLGRVPGVIRPAIATVLPTRNRPLLLLDAGANTDCHEEWLQQFAIMGDVYSRAVLKQAEPVLGLMSIGTEDGKGNEMTKKAFQLLHDSTPGIHFRGNVEGHDLFIGETDVIVCDGFVGNVILKTTESAAHAIGYWMKREFLRHPIRQLGALLLKGALHALKKRMDPEIYGGAPLLGVPGAVIITHGSSSHTAIYHAIIAAAAAASNNVSKQIEERIATLPAPMPAE